MASHLLLKVTESVKMIASNEFVIELERKEGFIYGWKADFTQDGLILLKSVNEGGLIDQWNRQHPSYRVEAGDLIIEVNGTRGEGMRAHLGKQAAGVTGTIKLTVRKGSGLAKKKESKAVS